MKKNVLFAAVFIFSGLSCSHGPSFLEVRDTNYHQILNSHTRESRFYSLEKVQYETKITFESPVLRTAYVEEYSQRYRLNEEQKSDLLKKQLEEADQYDVFFVSHYATDKDTSKLTKEANVWRLALSYDAQSNSALHEPESISTISSSDSVTRYFHPQLTPWSRAFRVKFKKQGTANSLNLLMAGVVDQIWFRWQLQ